MDLARAISYTRVMSTSPSGSKKSFRQLGGWRVLFSNPGLFLLTLFRGAHIGRDASGNEYFERPGRGKHARSRRWVVYAGPPEASTVPPEWHAWLHHLTDKPLPETGEKPWQRPHQPNLTGTPFGYRPPGHAYAGGVRGKVSADYESWTPDQG